MFKCGEELVLTFPNMTAKLEKLLSCVRSMNFKKSQITSFLHWKK